jgi:hypothetical protein
MSRISSFALLVLLVAGCSSDNNDNGGNNTPPPKPTLGATQIDRMGRAGVNTALTDPFDIVAGMTPNQVKDSYNLLSDPTTWSGNFKGNIATNLAILDSLDTVCGNQLLAGASAVAGRYDTLAGVLVDDRLYVRTDKTTCTTYLGVEANAVGVTNDDCGGRTPLYNTIDVTYSALAIGQFSGVTNGFTSDSEGNPNATTFPFLGAPN